MKRTLPHDDSKFTNKQAWHRKQAQLPLSEKFRILLQLQAQDLELIRRHRPLKWYEQPWPVKP